MNFKQILPYKLRRALTIGAIAGSTLTACEKNNEPIIPEQHDVELVFDGDGKNIDNILDITKYANMPDVRYIYMIPENEMDWCTCTQDNILNVRKYLELRIAVNPKKVRGKGNFCFKPGEASKIPLDSLWFIQHGWTINQKQR